MSPRPQRITVIVTTFERPRELRLVLEGLLGQQGAPPFEVAVCDDGSGPETAEVVAEVASRAPFEIHHRWHENTGFRAAATRNLGLRKARGDYVVFLDGDCIPFPSFLEQHVEAARVGRFLVGERHYLEDPASKALQPDQVARGEYLERVTVQEHRRVASRARKLALYRWSGLGRLKSRPKLVTANASAWLTDLQLINGFDERFEGWGHEDDDVGRRLQRIGVRPLSVAGEANVVHLWHPPQESFAGRVRDCPNAPYFHRGFYLTRCAKGLIERPWTDYRVQVSANTMELHDQAMAVLAEKLGGDATVANQAGEPAELSLQVWSPRAGRAVSGSRWPKGKCTKAEVHAVVMLPGDGEVDYCSKVIQSVTSGEDIVTRPESFSDIPMAFAEERAEESTVELSELGPMPGVGDARFLGLAFEHIRNEA